MAGLSLGNKNPRTKTGCKRKQDMMTFELNFNRNHKKSQPHMSWLFGLNQWKAHLGIFMMIGHWGIIKHQTLRQISYSIQTCVVSNRKLLSAMICRHYLIEFLWVGDREGGGHIWITRSQWSYKLTKTIKRVILNLINKRKQQVFEYCRPFTLRQIRSFLGLPLGICGVPLLRYTSASEMMFFSLKTSDRVSAWIHWPSSWKNLVVQNHYLGFDFSSHHVNNIIPRVMI